MKAYKKNIWEELELGFGGGSKFRILLYLILNPKEGFTKYALVKATGLRTPSVDGYLKVLIELNWIKEYDFNPTTYQINLKNEVVKEIYGLFQKISHLKGVI